MIAALYVETAGVYFHQADIDPWDLARDARLYAGPHRVIAHPPCERWGRYWSGGPMLAGTPRAKKLGDDGGCFAAAIAATRRFGGVLEHPEASHAWRVFGLARPPKAGGWIRADEHGWTCCVEQGHYGHPARKATWLYVVSKERPRELIWGSSGQRIRLDVGYHSKAERERAVRMGACQRLSAKQRRATPAAFRDLLIQLAREVHLTSVF